MDKILILVGSRSRNESKNESDYDYIALIKDIPKVKLYLEQKGIKIKRQWGNKKLSVIMNNGNKIDVFGVRNKILGEIMWSLPKNKVIGMKKLAKMNGFKLTNDQLFKNNKEIHVISYEDLKKKIW